MNTDYYMDIINQQRELETWNRECMEGTYNPAYAEEYGSLLARVQKGDKVVNESVFQDFLETHTAFIPAPFMLNHQLHFNSFISKMPLGTKWVTDFAYLTKSTVEWYVVLMEIENPHKKLFKGSKDHADFSADYTQSRQQIRDWKVYIDDHKHEVLESLHRIRKPLECNKVSFKYVMVMGSRSEIELSEERRRAIAEENGSGDLKIITYDILLSDYERQRRIPVESLVLTMYNGDRFRCKYLPSDEEHSVLYNIEASGLFAYMSCEDIRFTSEQLDVLRTDDFEMDSWLEGKKLTTNGRYTEAGYAKRLPEGSLVRAVLEE